MGDKSFDTAISRLEPGLHTLLSQVPDSIKALASEVRLRTGRPLSISSDGAPVLVMPGGRIAYRHTAGCHIVTPGELFESFRALCDYSVHAHQSEINSGFIALPGGHRAGISGRAVGDGNNITNIREVGSINIRIARAVAGCGQTVAEAFAASADSFILAGPPGSGKTTLLREVIRLLSGGDIGLYHNISVVDERHEIGGALDGIPQFDLGCCADLLSGYPKAAGVIAALRSLSPQVIAFDEVGDTGECEAVAEGLNSGVRFLITMHIGTREEIFRRPVSRALLDTGAFGQVFLLSGGKRPGEIKEVIRPYDDFHKNRGTHTDLLQLRAGGH